MEEKVIHRIFKYLEHKGIPHTRFEKMVGLSNGYLKLQLKRNADVGEKILLKIIDNSRDLNPRWLLTGEGNMLKEDETDRFNRALLHLIEEGTVKNRQELASVLGISIDQLERILAKKDRPSFALFNILTSKYGFNIEWLLIGRGEMKSGEAPAITPVDTPAVKELARPKIKEPTRNIQDVPLYDIQAAAGLNLLFSDQSRQLPVEHLRIPNLPKVDGAIFITGDSMYPILKAGDIVVFRRITNIPENILWGEIYILDIDMEGDQFVTIKYVQPSEKGKEYIKLISHNEHHKPKDIHIRYIRAMAHVKASIRFHTMV